jgi:hypothetical protein
MKEYYQKLVIPLWRKLTLLCFIFLSLTISVNAQEGSELSNALSAKPERCIALNEGQMCYQQISFTWQAKKSAYYCLRIVDENKQLFCWENSKQASYDYDLQSKTNKTFELIDAKGNVIATTSIEIAWVYKAKSQRPVTWRLF